MTMLNSLAPADFRSGDHPYPERAGMLQLFDESSIRHPTDPPPQGLAPIPANAAVYLYGESLQST